MVLVQSGPGLHLVQFRVKTVLVLLTLVDCEMILVKSVLELRPRLSVMS